MHSFPTTFRLADMQGDPINGTFYPQELQKIGIEKDKLYVIENVIKKRSRHGKQEYFVKFKGYPAKFNEWVLKEDVEV